MKKLREIFSAELSGSRPTLHTYPIGGRDDPYRLTRAEKECYRTGQWLFPSKEAHP